MPEARTLRIGPTHPSGWWEVNTPRGRCRECGGQCDGDDCGRHAAGCVFGGPYEASYWLIADGCPLAHGEGPDLSVVGQGRGVRKAVGEFLHVLSDQLHLRAHRLIGDPDWRARNG